MSTIQFESIHTFHGIVRERDGTDRHVRFTLPSATAKSIRRAVESRGHKLVSLSECDGSFVPAPKPYRKPMSPAMRSFSIATAICGGIIALGGALGAFAGIVGVLGGESWLIAIAATAFMAGYFAVWAVPCWLVTIGVIGLVELFRGWMRDVDDGLDAVARALESHGQP